MSMRCAKILVLFALAACGGDDDGGSSGPPVTFGGDRPVTLQIPEHTAGQTYPLVLILHGYGANGFLQQAYFGLDDLAERGDAFVLAPDGLTDSSNKQFWNADAVCCDFDGKNPDDVGYLSGMVEDVIASWPIDPKQVRVIGHSNGGYMAYRLACERSDLFTSIVSLAGNASTGVTCAPTTPIDVLHIHGTADATVPFTGAEPSVTEWANHNGCGTTRTPGETLDLDNAVVGAETQTATTTGCPAGGSVDLWTMTGSGHIPNLGLTFDTSISAWWADHARP
ncbi:MAG TPA: alpha/beta hydrolase-fold protein [Kofleriaceae bacterium]|nr:alpha/beta hydrolase-fold protein [Kofleriaceae bacterium]